MLRYLFALIAGLLGMVVTITLVEGTNAKFLFPPPADMDWNNAAMVAAYATGMPTMAYVIVLAGWLLGAFVGGGLAAILAPARKPWAALAIGALVVAGVVANALQIRHPSWVIAGGVLLPLPCAWLAARLAQKGLANTR